MILFSIQNKSFLLFLSFSMFLACSQMLGIFQPHVVIKSFLLKMTVELVKFSTNLIRKLTNVFYEQ